MSTVIFESLTNQVYYTTSTVIEMYLTLLYALFEMSDISVLKIFMV